MSKYRNPIPIMLTADDEAYFYQPITDLLNQLVTVSILIPSTDYFKLQVDCRGLHTLISEFTKLGVSLDNTAMNLNKGVLTIDANKPFKDFADSMHKSFTMQHVVGEVPEYLEAKEKMVYCKECTNKTCKLKEVSYCTRLYIASVSAGRTSK